uniref:Uncharacterized protein n=1 Tax=Romanomermis culicivorax TaxID=13658 RepID=A0A915I3E9_ROMCU
MSRCQSQPHFITINFISKKGFRPPSVVSGVPRRKHGIIFRGLFIARCPGRPFLREALCRNQTTVVENPISSTKFIWNPVHPTIIAKNPIFTGSVFEKNILAGDFSGANVIVRISHQRFLLNVPFPIMVIVLRMLRPINSGTLFIVAVSFKGHMTISRCHRNIVLAFDFRFNYVTIDLPKMTVLRWKR